MNRHLPHTGPEPHSARVASIVCSAVADLGMGKGWRVRMRAAEMLLTYLAGASVRIEVVRAVVYGFSAVHRRGEPRIPQTEAELLAMYDLVGRAMLVLGHDQPHAVLIVDGRVLVESFSWNDHNDPGVLIEPFARDLGPEPELRFTIDDVACGGAAAYERFPDASIAPLNRQYEQVALDLARACAPRVCWQLDLLTESRERSA